MRSDRQAPIFVVGAPRSGTTLLASMLAAHSRLSCGPETHFFDRLRTRLNSGGICDSRSWPQSAIEYVYSIFNCGRPIPDNYEISRAQIASYLAARRPSVPAILESLTEQFMLRLGKKRWVEKSPSHCRYVHQIRKYFPRSPIIRIIRDPRDVALSLLDGPWGLSTIMGAIWRWRRHDEPSARFFKTDKNSFTLHYEDLVLFPERKLKQVCEFIGEPFEPGMLDTSQTIRHTNKTNEPWKEKAGSPVDPSRIGNWMKCLKDDENRQVEAVIGDRLIAYGYRSLVKFDAFAKVYPLGALKDHSEVFTDLVSRGLRFWPAKPDETPAFAVYVGEPDRDEWLPHDRWGRLFKTISIGLGYWRSRIRGTAIYRADTKPSGMSGGYCSRVLCFCLRGSSPYPMAGGALEEVGAHPVGRE